MGLAHDHLNSRHRGFAIGVEQFRALPDDADPFLFGGGQKVWHADQRDQRDAVGVTEPHESGGRLLRGGDVQHAAQHDGLVADQPGHPPVDPRQRADDISRPASVQFEELPVVDQLGYPQPHVIRLIGLHHADLRDHAGRFDMAAEDSAITVQRHHPS